MREYEQQREQDAIDSGASKSERYRRALDKIDLAVIVLEEEMKDLDEGKDEIPSDYWDRQDEEGL